jgi:hypothetical protein
MHDGERVAVTPTKEISCKVTGSSNAPQGRGATRSFVEEAYRER